MSLALISAALGAGPDWTNDCNTQLIDLAIGRNSLAVVLDNLACSDGDGQAGKARTATSLVLSDLNGAETWRSESPDSEYRFVAVAASGPVFFVALLHDTSKL